MNKNITNFILTILLAIILAQFLPWWSIMLAAFLSALLVQLKKTSVFFIPFLAIALLWIVHSFWLGNANDFVLAKKISTLLTLGGNPYVLILVTGIIGGLAAGVAGVFGKQASLLFKNNS
ncbi:hypothetical protein RM697_04530 [Ichthyenterobacterium sp. W332]|uniref:Uncharacterized protein n=1 Tax=Microcosmobacter mediterraneus TaxID=3075607 RepID=A0ABU2YIA6_9FLAO|nr:hypothetical protein [Ichthyenterobacterium sp. W332]MDT0557898.1 hypothetical protein [Ichthyenterobacterium sp. W332]